MAEENIQLTKTIYSTKSTEGLVDRSFSEIFKTKDPIDLSNFFSIYGELFYDIPKTGKNSHTTIIKQSTDYIKNYIDPKEEQIALLTERIAELEEELNTPEEEHPFYANGTIIGQSDKPYICYYMDRGKRRSIQGGEEGEVFKALKASLGYNDDPESVNYINDYDIIMRVPKTVIDGITEGTILGLEDLTGQTEDQQLEQQLEQLQNIVVSDWKVELRDLVQPIENGSISSQVTFIILLKSKIKSEFQREGELESLEWKYYLDATEGYTQEEKDNGEKLLKLIRPKVQRSRQTLAILKRIWDKKSNFPNINFSEILPSTAAVNADGKRVNDKGSGTQMYPLTEEEVNDAYSGWEEGQNLFEGILEGNEYEVDISNIEYKGNDATILLNQGLIKVRYKKEKFIGTGFGGGYYSNRGYEELSQHYGFDNDINQVIEINNFRYTFDKYVYS